MDFIRRENSPIATLRAGIASYKDMKARTMRIARGGLRVMVGDPKIWFTSTESLV